MLHIKRDTKTGLAVFDVSSTDTKACDDTQPYPRPHIRQPHIMSFNTWLEQYGHQANIIVDTLCTTVYEMQCDKYIIKIKDDDALRADLLQWVYHTSYNKNKTY